MKSKNCLFLLILIVGVFILTSISTAADSSDPLSKWAPKFDPKDAKYRCIVSCVSTPALIGVHAGFEMRDELWKRSNGQIYIDYKPLSILGGEVEVLNMLQMGAVQGMGVSSVAATNLGPRFGIVNIPFLVDSFEKIDKFISSKALYDHFLNAMDHQGIQGIDITGYGNYGWATKIPVKTLKDAEKVKFRIAEGAVNQVNYRGWGLNPVAMPWPDVQIALKQGVINGLDHTPGVCQLTKKFEAAKYFTELNYAQGLFIWIFNKKWLNSLPNDLREIFIQTVKDVCADNRKKTEQWEKDAIASAKADGVQFFKLSDKDMQFLKDNSAAYEKYAKEINQLYKGDKYRPKDYLKEVKDFLK